MGSASVLIIANPFEARVLGRAVDTRAYRCTICEGGDAVAERLKESAPDVVVLARELYGIEDDAMWALLRAHTPPPQLVVIDDGSEGWPPAEPAAAARLQRPIEKAELAAALSQLLAEPAPSYQSASREHSGMLRLDDALGPSALSPGSRGGWPIRGVQRPPTTAASRAAETIADPVDHLALDSLPGIDDELGLGAAPTPAGPPQIAPAPVAPAVVDVGDAGDLRDEGPAVVVARLHRTGYTGRLVLRQGDADKSLYFEGGFVVHATSSLPHDGLGELLWREGKVSREQLALARTASEERGSTLVEALVETSALRRDEVFQTLRLLVEEIVYSSFGWDRGSWALDREVASRSDMLSVGHPYALVMEGVRRKYSLERLSALLGPQTTTVQSLPTLLRVSADAGLLGGEREVVQQLRRGARTVAELRTAGKLDEIGALALIHGLHALGAVTVGSAGDGEVAAAENGRGAPHGDPIEAEAVPERERARALAKYAQVLEGDYFAVLGTTRASTSYEIRRAYERARGEFSPDRYPLPLRDELAEKLTEIAEVIDEAWRALSDERLREVYRSHLSS